MNTNFDFPTFGAVKNNVAILTASAPTTPCVAQGQTCVSAPVQRYLPLRNDIYHRHNDIFTIAQQHCPTQRYLPPHNNIAPTQQHLPPTQQQNVSRETYCIIRFKSWQIRKFQKKITFLVTNVNKIYFFRFFCLYFPSKYIGTEIGG